MKSTKHGPKRFGTFLVERSVITEDMLVDALTKQDSMRPSKYVVAIRLGVLTVAESKTVCAFMNRHNCAFDSAVLSLALPAHRSVKQIAEERAKYDPKLGVVLMMMGALDADQLYSLLQRFQQESQHNKAVRERAAGSRP